MTLTEIEQEFYQVIPDIIDKVNTYVQLEHPDFQQIIDFSFMTDFTTCIVGSVREKIGLHNDYARILVMDKQCNTCVDIAQEIYEVTHNPEQRNLNTYQTQLKRLKTHLKREHNKELKKEQVADK